MTTSLLSSLLIAITAVGSPTVWVTHATQKIRPSDAPGATTSADVKAARNEFEAFQVAVHGGTSGVTGVRAAAPTLTGPQGSTIPAANVRLYREGLITTRYASTMEVTTGAWPDPLIPDFDETASEKRNAFPFNVPAGENRAVWVDVLVPADAVAGEYRGTIVLTGDGGWSASVPVTLTVWPFTLPSTSSLASTFGLGWDTLCQAYYGGYDSPSCGDAGIVRTHQQIATFMLDHRLTVDMVYSGPASSGSGYDWTTWDAQYGPWFDGAAPTRLKGAKQTLLRYMWNPNGSSYSAWAQHFRAKGWFDRTYDYTCDEPPATCAWSDILSRAATIHAADPQFRTLVTTTIQQASAQGVLSSIDILAPVINETFDKSGLFAGNQRPNYDSFIANGGRMLWYQSCMSQGCGGSGPKSYDSSSTGWATVMIDAPAIRNRAMEWLSFLFDISGELYWETTFAFGGGNDPWTNQWYFGGNGDGTLFYPGTPAKIGGSTPVPVASIRLKMIREGMEDFEYLKLVSDLGDASFAKAQAAKVASDPYTITGDPSVLYSVRTALAERILQLSHATPCSGGTAEGACAAEKPFKCSSGSLVAACTTCGCPAGQVCGTNGGCAAPVPGLDAGTGSTLPVADAGRAMSGGDGSTPVGADSGAPQGGSADGSATDAASHVSTDPLEIPASCQSVAGAPLSLLALLGLMAFRKLR